MYFYSIGMLDKDSYRSRLQNVYSEMIKNEGEGAKITSELRAAITYIDYGVFRSMENRGGA